MKKVYIAGAVRTPIGKMGGALSSVSAVTLGGLVIREALHRSKIPPEEVDHVYMGCVIQAGLGQNVARQAALEAGLPVKTTAETVNVVCGSGLDAVNSGARMIACGDADLVVAGGMENMSQAPFAMMQGRFGYRMGAPMVDSGLIDTMVHDALWDAVYDYHMGITAENVAEKWGITRQELDEFAAISQQKAVESIKTGVFKDEIMPVTVKGKKKEVVVDTDEGPRPGTTAESLAGLGPAFKPDGIVTAGNSSGINDGAAAVVLVSEDKMKELGIRPMAVWLGGALGGTDPAIMGVGPIESTRTLFAKLGMTMDDMDLVEANEAFAAQSIAVQRELGIPREKLNIGGGAIALGHPVGASGARILTTLLYHLKRTGKKRGLATLCIGGGMGCSCVVEAV